MLITTEQAVSARDELQLSQAKVSKDTGINRSYISGFERKRRLLSDDDRETLWDYYLSQGWVPAGLDDSSIGDDDEYIPSSGEHTGNQSKNLKIKDGFVIPNDHLVDYEVEALLTEYHSIDATIAGIEKQAMPTGLLGGVSEDAADDIAFGVLKLRNRQLSIISELKGDLQQAPMDESDSLDNLSCMGEYIKQITSKRLAMFRDDQQELEESIG